MDIVPHYEIKSYQSSVTPLWDGFYAASVAPLIIAAKKRIYVTSYKFEPKDTPRARRVNDLIILLSEALARGVDVRIMLNFQDNRAATSGINWYAAKELAKNSVYARYVPGVRILHAKIMTIDDRYAVVGSHNYSVMSHDQNIEFSILVESNHFNKDLQEELDRYWLMGQKFPGT